MLVKKGISSKFLQTMSEAAAEISFGTDFHQLEVLESLFLGKNPILNPVELMKYIISRQMIKPELPFLVGTNHLSP